MDADGLGLEVDGLICPGLVLDDVLGLGLEDVVLLLVLDALGLGLVLGSLGLFLDTVGLLGPGLIVLDALGIGLEDVVLFGPGLVLDALGLGLEDAVLLGSGLVLGALGPLHLPLRVVWGRVRP